MHLFESLGKDHRVTVSVRCRYDFYGVIRCIQLLCSPRESAIAQVLLRGHVRLRLKE